MAAVTRGNGPGWRGGKNKRNPFRPRFSYSPLFIQYAAWLMWRASLNAAEQGRVSEFMETDMYSLADKYGVKHDGGHRMTSEKVEDLRRGLDL
jgi:hypothetical protein